MIKAIETHYKGYRFRSRLEARWAVYFDAQKLKWEYEPQGFDLDGVAYLPDFWLPQVRMWAEVKPEQFTDDELNKAGALAKATGHRVLLLIGTPDYASYTGVQYVATNDPENPDDWEFTDYVLESPREGWRFWSSTGWDAPGQGPFPIPARDFEYWRDDLEDAVRAARSARFEHGEAP